MRWEAPTVEAVHGGDPAARAKLIEFLKQSGYLETSIATKDAWIFVPIAIGELQKCAGLPQNGAYDAATSAFVDEKGWQVLDSNPSIVQMISAGGREVKLHKDGSIFEYTYSNNQSQWVLIDKNPRARLITADWNSIYQWHDNGQIWKKLNNDGSNHWTRVDANPNAAFIIASSRSLYQSHIDGQIFKYMDHDEAWERIPDGSAGHLLSFQLKVDHMYG